MRLANYRDNIFYSGAVRSVEKSSVGAPALQPRLSL